MIRALVTLLLAFAVSAGAYADVSCKDEFKYTLGAQIENEGFWLSFSDQSTLPINHKGGDGLMSLAVDRIDGQWLQLNAALVTTSNVWTWKLQLQMDQQAPKSFTKTFRPQPDMPMFAIALVPVCSGA